MRILIASGNKGKVRELKAMLEPLGIETVSPHAIGGLPEVEEDGDTFEANATKKAVEAAMAIGIPVFADDSGLEVRALDDAPGVLSARYAGPDASDADRVNKLLHSLAGVADRAARFVCVIAVATPCGACQTFRGEIKGQILDSPKGESGFGYDPVFVPDGYSLTFAELTADIKNKVSHRAQALKLALPAIVAMAQKG